MRGLEIFAVLWYNNSSKKATSERNLWFAWGGRKYGVWIATTFLTIYGFGLRGNSARKSTRKQWFQIKKHQKSLKNPYFTRLLAFGTSMPSVRIRPLRPEKSTCLRKCFFQLNPPMTEEIHLRWMKSLRDEICLTAGDKGGFNFIWGGTPKISSELAGFHRATHDFIPFGSIAGFEPAKCYFWYRFPTAPNLWIDSNRHTVSEAFQKFFQFKIYLRSRRCKGILDRFELAKGLKYL